MNKLHFGCFNLPQKGWVNTDVTPHIWISRIPGLATLLYNIGKMTPERYKEHQEHVFSNVKYMNVCKPWSFKDQSLTAIFSSHVIEHLSLADARNILREAHRCLAPDGILRISVPDLEKSIEKYSKEDSFHWSVTFFEADQKFEKNMHHFMYDFNSMHKLMLEAGFRKIYKRNYREGLCPNIESLDNRPEESLFVEAIK